MDCDEYMHWEWDFIFCFILFTRSQRSFVYCFRGQIIRGDNSGDTHPCLERLEENGWFKAGRKATVSHFKYALKMWWASRHLRMHSTSNLEAIDYKRLHPSGVLIIASRHESQVKETSLALFPLNICINTSMYFNIRGTINMFLPFYI